MRKLSADEISRASAPKTELYVAPANCSSVAPALSGVSRSVHLDGEYVFVDRESYAKVCARLGVSPG